jgi:hypothetical protein
MLRVDFEQGFDANTAGAGFARRHQLFYRGNNLAYIAAIPASTMFFNDHA